MHDGSLSLFPEPGQDITAISFHLVGCIDANAASALEKLAQAPLPERIKLDFSGVQRVNSMGLAQLLKTFEVLQQRNIQVQVANANRMIRMLFKMTGMQHFLQDGDEHPVSQISLSAGKMPPAPTLQESPTPAIAERQEERLRFRVSLQSSQQLGGWFFFNTYLQRQLSRSIHFEPSNTTLGLVDPGQASTGAELIYAKPFDACALMLGRGYEPLMRPQGQTDEVCILIRADDARRNLQAFSQSRVATASPNSVVYLLGRFLLDESGLDSSTLSFIHSGEEIKALQLLLKGQVDMVFMLSENYRSLSSLTRNATYLLDESDVSFAFHILCVAPGWQRLRAPLQELLPAMSEHDKSRQILKDMHIAGWEPPAQEELSMLLALFQRYVSGPELARFTGVSAA